jgi:hypothetical protein
MKPMQNLHARSSRRESALIPTKARGEVEPTHTGCYRFFLMLLLAAILASAGGSVAAGETWLSSTNSLAYLNTQTNFGAGTIQNPYYGDFDYIMGNFIPANSTVHLGGGIFWTKGWNAANANVFDIPAGVTVQGEGEAFTTIRRATNFTGYIQQNLTVLHSDSSNVTVCNLTIDCNAFDFHNQNWSNAVMGIALHGSRETIEHVTDVNGLGFQFAPEGFQLDVGAPGQGNNSITGCTTSNFLGTYGDGVSATGDCLIEGNQVYFSPQSAGIPWYPRFGINVGFSVRGSLITGNYVYGGGDGFHNDTGGDTNLTIANNVFENVCEGVALTGDTKPYNSVIVSHNLMLMQTNYTSYHDQMFMVLIGTTQSGQTNQNITVDGNTIRFYNNQPWSVTNANGVIGDGVQGAMYVYGGGINQLNENISIINNQIDARMPVTFAGNISNLYASGNIPLNGTNFATANGYPGLTNVMGSQTVNQQ